MHREGESQPKLLKPVVHLFEMEVEGAQLLQFALLEMLGHGWVGLELLDEIRVVAAGVFDFQIGRAHV